MNTYEHQGRNLKINNRVLMLVIALLCITVAGMTVGMVSLARSITVYIPPDTSGGVTLNADDPLPSDVFGFANYIMQYVNHWPKDGEVDYPERINNISFYITPTFKADLDKDVRHSLNNNGINELQNRIRQLNQDPDYLFNRANVKIVAQDVWTVDLTYRLIENVGPLEVKNVLITMPMRVVKSNVNLEENAWGLQLDGYAGPITRIDDVYQISKQG